MTDDDSSRAQRPPPLAADVGAKAKRKQQARRHPSGGLWLGLGMMGLVGWSVTIPALLGTALGLWLDKYHPGHHAWTLALLVAGLTLGCFNAWHWVAQQQTSMRREQENDDD